MVAGAVKRMVRVTLILACAGFLAACGVAVRGDRAAIGGGPEQATEQARVRFQATVVAFATTVPVAAQACDCEFSGK